MFAVSWLAFHQHLGSLRIRSTSFDNFPAIEFPAMANFAAEIEAVMDSHAKQADVLDCQAKEADVLDRQAKEADVLDGQSDEEMVAKDAVEQELPGFKAWLPTVWPISHSTASPSVNQTYCQWLQTALTSQSDSRLYNLYDMAVSPGCDAGWRSVSLSSLLHKVDMYVQDRWILEQYLMFCHAFPMPFKIHGFMEHGFTMIFIWF